MSGPATGQTAQEASAILDRIPFAGTLGMRGEMAGGALVTVLPFSEKLIGNVSIRALHGGAIAAFLELTAMLQMMLAANLEVPPRPVNITVDYLRQGQARDLFARATILKQGRRIASVRAEAFHSDQPDPVSAITAHFMLAE